MIEIGLELLRSIAECLELNRNYFDWFFEESEGRQRFNLFRMNRYSA